MFVSADTMSLLMASGVPADKLVEIVRSIERDVEAVRPIRATTSGAERQARYRARLAARNAESVTSDVTSDGDSDVTSQAQIGTPFSQENIPPSPPKGGSSPTGAALSIRPKRVRIERPRFAPDDFTPSPAHIVKVEQRGLSPGDFDRALSRFKNHEFRNPPTDWSRAFHKWLDGEKPSNDRSAADPRADARSVWADIIADRDGAGACAPEPRRLAG